jgi:hypothetical protein
MGDRVRRKRASLYRKRRVRAPKPAEPHTLAASRTCARLEAIHNERLY